MCDMHHTREQMAFYEAFCDNKVELCDMTHAYVWHDSFICVTWLMHTCDMTHSYVWHDSFICVTWLMHTCDMTHSYVWHHVTWLIHMCAMLHTWEQVAFHEAFCDNKVQLCQVLLAYSNCAAGGKSQKSALQQLIQSTGGGDQTENNYNCQKLQQIFTGVPVRVKHLFTGVPKISNEDSRG